MVLYVDIGSKMLVKSDGLNRLAAPDHPQVFEGSQEVFDITFFKDGAAHPINASDTFAATLDNNFIHTDDIMASSSAFTIVDASTGRVNISMLFTAASFTAKLAGAAKITAYLDIKRYIAGDTVPETFLQDTVSARASIAASEGSPETGNPEYYNSSQVDALIAAATQAPPASLSIGTVSSGTTAAATVTGNPPNQTLNLTLPKGSDGTSPHIGENGNWYIGNTDTGVSATGEDGTPVQDFSFTVAVDSETGAVTASYTPDGGEATSLTVSEDYQTITIPLAALGISGLYTFFLFDSAGRLLASTAELSYQITGGNLLLTWGTGWTAGTWTLHGQSGKGKQGDQGLPGESGSTYAGWTTLTYAASIALSRSTEMKENQRVTLTGDVTLTAPTLSGSYPLLLLEITTAGYAVNMGAAELIAASNSTYLVGWYWNGSSTRRLEVMEVL